MTIQKNICKSCRSKEGQSKHACPYKTKICNNENVIKHYNR